MSRLNSGSGVAEGLSACKLLNKRCRDRISAITDVAKCLRSPDGGESGSSSARCKTLRAPAPGPLPLLSPGRPTRRQVRRLRHVRVVHRPMDRFRIAPDSPSAAPHLLDWRREGASLREVDFTAVGVREGSIRGLSPNPQAPRSATSRHRRL